MYGLDNLNGTKWMMAGFYELRIEWFRCLRREVAQVAEGFLSQKWSVADGNKLRASRRRC